MPPDRARSPVARIDSAERHALRNRLFSWRRVDRLDHLGLARPEQHLLAAGGRDLGQRGAPGAGADHPDPHAFTPAPRAFSASGSSGQRARAGASSPSISPASKRSAPGPGDHRRIVGAQPQRRRDEGQAVRRGELGRARRGSPGWRRRRRRRPARWRRPPPPIARRGAVDQAIDHRLLEGGGDVGVAVAARSAWARSTALLRPAKEKCGSSEPSSGRGSGTAAGSPVRRRALDRRARRESRGRAAWRSCRTPRRRHRRSWWRAGGSGRRPRPSSNWQWPPETSSSR